VSQFTDALTLKLGPLPAWAYGLGLGLGIVGYRAYRDRHAAAQVATAEDQAAADLQAAAAEPGGYTSGTTGAYSIPAALANAGGQPYLTPAQPSTESTGPVDNTAWRQESIARLIALHYSPTAAQEAIETYLRGDPITEQQEAMIDVAIRTVGAPPDGAPPILRRSAPPVASPPATPVPSGGAGGVGAPSAPQPPIVATPAPAPAPAAPWQPPAWLSGVRFVKGTGDAVYLVEPGKGIEWIASEQAYYQLGGTPGGYTVVPDSVLRTFPRVGVLPDRVYDPSLP
jgi:hypothetical protein